MMYTRDLLTSLYQHSQEKACTVLLGARQLGKTTLFKQLEVLLNKDNKPTYFFSLEQQEILHDLNQHPENLFKYVPKNGQKKYVLIDEIQYLKDPSLFMKLMYDEYSKEIKLMVTGSSAFYIDKKFTDSLAGRKKIFELYPFTLKEFLHFKGEAVLWSWIIQKQQGIIQKTPQIHMLWALWEEYLIYGGYPEVVLSPQPSQKIELLHELKNSFIKRDVLESGIREEDKFFHTMRLLAEKTGQLVNINEFANTLRSNHVTIEHFIWTMRKCFHIELVRSFYKNLRKELTKMPKIYFHDTGIRNALIHQFLPINQRLDKGALLENAVFTLLRNKFSDESIHFWRTADGNEVDFVIPWGEKPQAYEVKFSEQENKIKSFKKFTETYPSISFKFMNWRTDSLFELVS